MGEKNSSAGFSSPLMLAISLIAASVGTGNIWRCPRVAATNGGAAFIIAYVAMMVFLILPVMVGEHCMGRATRKGTCGAFRDFMGKKVNGVWKNSLKGTWMGSFVWWVVIICAAYYVVVVAWIAYYLYLSITGQAFVDDKQALFESVANHNPIVVILFILLQVICAYGAYKGIGGIEKSVKILLPILFFCLLIIAGRSITLPGASAGANFLFNIDPANLLDVTVWREALIQALWSAGPGWAICIAYGVYSKTKSDAVITESVQAFGDMSVALLATMAIIPALFSVYGQQLALEYCASGSNGLAFIALTGVFQTLPGGRLFAALFWIALLCASITTQIAIISILYQPLADLGFTPKKCAIVGGGLIILVGIPSAWSLDFFSNQDFVVGMGMVFGAGFSCIAFIKYGAEKVRQNFINNPYTGLHMPKWWTISVYITPVLCLVIIVYFSVSSITTDPQWYSLFRVESFGTYVIQLGIFGILFAIGNKWIYNHTSPMVFDGEHFSEPQDNGFSTQH